MKRFLACLLCVCMALSVCVMGASAASAEAKIGDTGYTTLADAVTAANSGDTITLLSDVTLTAMQAVDKTITLDLNGHAVSNTSAVKASGTVIEVNGGELTVKDSATGGKITSAMGNGIRVVGDETPGHNSAKSSKLTFESGTIEAQECGIVVLGNGAEVIVNGGTVTGKDNFGIGGNGTKNTTKDDGGYSITINGGTITGNTTSTGYANCGIYHPNAGSLTINGGTITGTTGAGVVVRGGDLTVTGGTISGNGTGGENTWVGDKNPTYCGGIEIGYSVNYPAAIGAISISGGNISSEKGSAVKVIGTAADSTNSQSSTISITGGTFSDFSGIPYCTSGTTYKLGADVDLTTTLVISKNITLDLDGHTISNTVDIWNDTNDTWSLISVQAGGALTITGNGKLGAKENDCYAIDIRGGASCIIKNGTYVGNISAVYVYAGSLTINGGNFSIKQANKLPQADGTVDPKVFTLNCYDMSYANNEATITVTGGSFDKYDPSNSDSENPVANFVASGYAVSENNGTYTVYVPYVPSAPAVTEPVTTTTTDKTTGTDGSVTETTTTTTVDKTAGTTTAVKAETTTTADGAVTTTETTTVTAKDGATAVATVTTDAAGTTAAAATVEAAKNSTAATVPAEVLKTVAEAKTEDATLTVTTKDATIKLDAAAIDALAEKGGEAPVITAEAVAKTELTAEQQAIVGDAPVIELTVNGGSVDFGAGTVSVSVPYTLKDGEKAEGMVAWFLNDAGKLEQCECVYVNGVLTFETSHFSKYVVAYFPFTDVKSGEWYYENVVYAFSNNLFKGMSDTSFAPGETMTRQMIWTVLARMDGKTPANYDEAREWAMTSGISDGTNAAAAITREELVTTLYRYAKYKGYDVSVGEDTNILSYTDAESVSEWAVSAMQWACGAGIVNGSDGALIPQGGALRSQVAAMLQRYAENVK